MLTQDIPSLGDMDLDEFRSSGHQLVDWIADYLSHPDQYPVLSSVRPGDTAAGLPDEPPEQPTSMTTILTDFEELILPGITHWNHPGFFSYFGISASGPGILGELLIAALNVNGMLWRTSPAATELEQVTLNWLRQMLGLPEDFYGIINDTASISSMLAIASAREALNLDIRHRGMVGRTDLPRLRLYISDQTHSSVEKGAIILGIGQEWVKKIPTDDAFRMDVDLLRKAIEEDIHSGVRPFCVIATVGTTATTSIDPVPEIAALCKKFDLWLHVDGAYGGMAAIIPEMRHVLAGVELADSFVVNPHKWLFTPIDCSAFYVRDPEILVRAFSLVPEYLKSSEEGVTNYMDWGVQLGRRFRSLKLWMVIRHFGWNGLAARLQEHIRIGQKFAEWVDDDPHFERLAPAPFSVVCFRAMPSDLAQRLQVAGPEETRQIETFLDQLNEKVVDIVNATGEIFLSPTTLRGRFTIRLAVGNIRSDELMITRAWELLRQAAQQLDTNTRTALLLQQKP